VGYRLALVGSWAFLRQGTYKGTLYSAMTQNLRELFHTRESSKRPRSIPMQPHLSSVVLCLLLHNMVGSKTL
jgi:hypothetical protein